MSRQKVNYKIDNEAIENIISRFKRALNITYDNELSDIIGKDNKTFSNMKRSGALLTYLYQLAVNNKMDLNWLFYGEEQPIFGSTLENITRVAPWRTEEQEIKTISDSEINNDDRQYIEGQHIFELLKKATDVLESKGIERTALASNINAFHISIKRADQIEKVSSRMDAADERDKQTKRMIDELAQQMKSLQEENDLLKKLLPQGGILKIGETVPNGPPVEEKHHKDPENIWKEGVTIPNQPPGRKTK